MKSKVNHIQWKIKCKLNLRNCLVPLGKMFDLPLILQDSNIQNYFLPRFHRVVKVVLKTVLENMRPSEPLNS